MIMGSQRETYGHCLCVYFFGQAHAAHPFTIFLSYSPPLSLSLLGPELTIHKVINKSKGERTYGQGQQCGDCRGLERVEVEEEIEGIIGNDKYMNE